MTIALHIERRKAPRTNSATTRTAAAPAHVHRERDFGVGYGNSSGYASNRRYIDTRSQTYFRCR